MMSSTFIRHSAAVATTPAVSAAHPVASRAHGGAGAHSASATAGGVAIWFKLAVVYLLIGVGFGIGMGATGNFVLRPVHVHVGLLGWVTLALAGLVYQLYPAAAASRLMRVHFWLHNLALPVMMVALGALLLGHSAAIPALVASEFALAAGLVAFAVNVFRNLGR